MLPGRILPGLLATMAVGGLVPSAVAADPSAKAGVVEFVPVGDESALPEQFRLKRHTFRYQQRPLPTLGKVMTVSKVTFPSPVVTPHPNNNTVHCEYFCPTAAGPKPGVVVLHILGGDFDLARLFCRAMATRGVAALFLKMPYYGERRQEGSPARMVSMDPYETARGMTQAALDIRQAAGWLAAQQEIDDKQIGVLGISLGGITAALAAGIEPRLTKACLILAGGDMGEVAWQSTEMTELREHWTAAGHTKEELFEVLRPVDPVTYARPVPGRKILMLNASRDEVVPPACTRALWRAFGEPEIVWWDAGHFTAVRYLFSGAARAVEFFQPEGSRAAAQSTAK
ncbi:MAG: alpha/beta hydrolase family protein [Pirellulales bacterium]